MQTKPFDTVCVVGAGFMGAQIGLQCATHDYAVWLVDSLVEGLQRAAQSHSQELDRRLETEQITAEEKEAILGRVHLTTNIQEGACKADLVIEVVPERLELKREIFAQLDAVCPSQTILAR